MELKKSAFYFDKVDFLSKCISFATFIISCLSIAGIFLNSHWLYSIATFTFLIQLITWIAMYYKTDYAAKAISTKRLEMLRGIIGEDNFYRERLYIDGDAEDDNNHHYEKLTLLIQENAYWNSILYIKTFHDKLCYLLVTIFALILIIIIMYASVTDNLDFQYSRTIFGILVFNNFYNLFSEASGSLRAHHEMKKIDDFIEINKHKSPNFVSYIYSKYEHEIFVAPSINKGIYQKNNERIRHSWIQRLYNKNNFQSEKFINAVTGLTSLLQPITDEWNITGGANRYLRGVQIYANDIDIITTEKGANEICKLITQNFNGNLYKTTSGNIKSYYFTFTYKGITIEIMGDPENKDELGWHKNKEWEKNQDYILLNGIKVPCVSLDYEIEINKQIGNYNAFKDTGFMDFHR
ncbi:nucleotidyltransferase domain-containing protein [Mangrovibacter phragmitis]|uniref:nucleotidyltransferase domain-containing protein n=1 Tax=Mangrovibacter phragmitis TaxID=1691903 RepID=UPI00336A28B3